MRWRVVAFQGVQRAICRFEVFAQNGQARLLGVDLVAQPQVAGFKQGFGAFEYAPCIFGALLGTIQLGSQQASADTDEAVLGIVRLGDELLELLLDLSERRRIGQQVEMEQSVANGTLVALAAGQFGEPQGFVAVGPGRIIPSLGQGQRCERLVAVDHQVIFSQGEGTIETVAGQRASLLELSTNPVQASQSKLDVGNAVFVADLFAHAERKP